jgi:hypothetical protein
MQTQEEQFIHIDKDGDKLYHKDKEMKIVHRLDGPAVETSNGYKAWYFNGKRHRLDGPAIIYTDGSKFWYVDGKCLTKDEFIALTVPKVIELTLDQIAEKFGISVDNLKIVK